MLVVGLTGGIGSGKSTVANLFAKQGVPIIDADIIAREIVLPDEPAYKEIVTHFGSTILDSENIINRAKLREIIFNDEGKRRLLENILHPAIRLKIKHTIKQIKGPYCVVVIPLLIETSAYDNLTRILVVDSPVELQIARVKIRDKHADTEIQAILNTQVTREARLAEANDVIVNDGSLADLTEQVLQLHQYYLTLAQQLT